jgi:hypothetical protein
MQERLGRRLGPNWQETSAGIQAQRAFEQSTASLREEARHRQLQTYGTLGAQGAERLLQTPGSRLGVAQELGKYGTSLIPSSMAVFQPSQYQQQLAMQAAQYGRPLAGAAGGIIGSELGYGRGFGDFSGWGGTGGWGQRLGKMTGSLLGGYLGGPIGAAIGGWGGGWLGGEVGGWFGGESEGSGEISG